MRLSRLGGGCTLPSKALAFRGAFSISRGDRLRAALTQLREDRGFLSKKMMDGLHQLVGFALVSAVWSFLFAAFHLSSSALSRASIFARSSAIAATLPSCSASASIRRCSAFLTAASRRFLTAERFVSSCCSCTCRFRSCRSYAADAFRKWAVADLTVCPLCDRRPFWDAGDLDAWGARSFGRSDVSANRLFDPTGLLSTTPGWAIATSTMSASWTSFAKF